jgi:type II secretory pathway pseudopilin PulG
MNPKPRSELRGSAGYTVVEALTVVAAMGAVAAVAAPSMMRFRAAQDVQAATSQVGGMLQQVRSRAAAEGIPYLVLFQREEVSDGARGAFALIVRDNDRSYSLTPPDDVETFALDPRLRPEVRQYGEGSTAPLYADMQPPERDRSPRLRTLAEESSLSGSGSSGSGSSGSGSSGSGGLLGGLGGIVDSLLGGGSGSSGSGTDSSSSGSLAAGTVQEVVTNGASFEISGDAGVPAVAFNERGIPVALDSPGDWGSGAGAVYLTDNENAVYAAVVGPLGEISTGRYDAATASWK